MSDLIKALQRKSAYNHPVTGFKIIETHISTVILTGEYAYKIKKPVDFGFLDYSSLEKRQAFCEKELAFNQPLAGEIYQEVCPIYDTAEGPSFVGEGPVIEYALKMREFEQDELLHTRIDQHRHDYELAAQLAETLAGFRDQAELAAEDSDFGQPDVVWHPVAENFAQARELLSEAKDLEQLQQIEDWATREFSRLKDNFAKRRQQKAVRACHGDVHLGNIIVKDGKPVIFDCIEFNEYLRWLDTMAEIGFLMMDLLDHQCPQLAARFLSMYVEQTGDYEGLALLPFYISYRAMVRAKIQLFQINDQQPAEANQKLLDKYRSYAKLADTLITPKQPSLIITMGLSGSGKSTTAGYLVNEFDAIRIRSDVERKRIFPNAEKTVLYSEESLQKTYEHLAALSGTILDAGYSVVIDATNLLHHQRALFEQVAKQKQVSYVIVNCEASEQHLQGVIQSRATEKDNVSDADLTVLNYQMQQREPLTAYEQSRCLEVQMVPNYDFPSLKTRLERLLQGDELAAVELSA